MRKDTSFSDGKLTNEEFSKKYWRNGLAPFQYHTGTISDGRDEREQFVFNNVRALKEMIGFENRRQAVKNDNTREEIKRIKKKVATLTSANVAIVVLNIILLICIILN